MIKCSKCRKEPTVVIGANQDTYCSHSHYSVCSLDDIDDLKRIFPEGKCNTLNWFYLSTSGVHGSYTTLDDIEKGWDIVKKEGWDEEVDDWPEGYCGRDITVGVLMPRMAKVIYGNIELETRDDIRWLRELLNSSIEAIVESQEGNFPERIVEWKTEEK